MARVVFNGSRHYLDPKTSQIARAENGNEVLFAFSSASRFRDALVLRARKR
jgi:hypothetical protein